jgi:hypothetical protein
MPLRAVGRSRAGGTPTWESAPLAPGCVVMTCTRDYARILKCARAPAAYCYRGSSRRPASGVSGGSVFTVRTRSAGAHTSTWQRRISQPRPLRETASRERAPGPREKNRPMSRIAVATYAADGRAPTTAAVREGQLDHGTHAHRMSGQVTRSDGMSPRRRRITPRRGIAVVS